MSETGNPLRWTSRELLVHIARPLLPEVPALNGRQYDEVERDVVNFLAAEIEAMPSFLRLPYQLALHGYNWLALPRYGRRYVKLDAAQQQRYMVFWAESRIGAMRDVVKLVRSCVLLQYMDHSLVRSELESPESDT